MAKSRPSLSTIRKRNERLLNLFKDNNGARFDFVGGQKEIFKIITSRRPRYNQIIACTQYGKLCANTTQVFTTDGWKNHGDLEVGDKVFNHKGEPVKVLAVHPKQYADREVEFSNGEKIKCSKEHEWRVRTDDGDEYYDIETQVIESMVNEVFVLPREKVRKGNCTLEEQKNLKVKNVRKIDPVEGNCITVEGGIYCVGKSMIPTHNSLIIALAILCSAALGGHKWAIVAPTKKQAMIIMNYIIEHSFDHILLSNRLMTDTKLDKLKRQRSRERLVFKGGGEVFVISADASNKKKAGESLMGYGAPNLAIDESSLIDDQIYSKIMRMVGGKKDHFVVEIGNPFKRNHFYRTYQDPDYNHIVIDHKQAMEEGRMTQEYINKMKKQPDFSVQYACEFPDESAVDNRGYTRLVRDGPIDRCVNRDVPELIGDPRLGVDIGRGNDSTVFVVRYENYMKVLESNKVTDLMHQVKRVHHWKDKLNIENNYIFIDDIGVGGGVVDACKNEGIAVTPVKAAESPQNGDRFVNARSEMYWDFKKWIEADENSIESHKRLNELRQVKYKKERGSSRLRIEPKDEIKRRLGNSPDVADAMSLTFYPTQTSPELFVL